VWRRACEARDEALASWLRASADLALVGEGVQPGFEGDNALRQARRRADKTSVTPTEFRTHPIVLMFRRAQLKPEWRCLFDEYWDLVKLAAGKSEGVVDLQREVIEMGVSHGIEAVRLHAMQMLERKFRGPIRKKAGDRALEVFELTNGLKEMTLKEAGAALGCGRNKAGQILKRAYETLADYRGITAERARARFRREAGSQSTFDIVEPLTPAERAEVDAYEAGVDAEVRERAAARFQQGKERAMDLQRRRRAGAR
jgi:hypothetical protein